MIDWLSFNLPLDWQEPINDGRFVSLRWDGSVEYQTDKSLRLEGSHQSSLSVRSVERGMLEVRGNPAKWFQGHNLFGTDDLHGLFLATAVRIAEVVGVEPSSEDLAAWVRGDVALSRVDCTAMYELDTRTDVLEWLRAASGIASVKYRGRGHFQEGTLTFGMVNKGGRAKDWQLVLYAKGEEISLVGHHLADGLPWREQLMDWADNKLRMELRLRTRELKRFGLHTVGAWGPSQCSETLGRYLGKVDMSEQQLVHVDIPEHPGLKSRHKQAIACWRSGVDMKSVMPRQTFYRVRKELMELCDLDIGSRANVSNVVPLRRVLEARPASLPSFASDVLFVPPPRLRAA